MTQTDGRSQQQQGKAKLEAKLERDEIRVIFRGLCFSPREGGKRGARPAVGGRLRRIVDLWERFCTFFRCLFYSRGRCKVNPTAGKVHNFVFFHLQTGI